MDTPRMVWIYMDPEQFYSQKQCARKQDGPGYSKEKRDANVWKVIEQHRRRYFTVGMALAKFREQTDSAGLACCRTRALDLSGHSAFVLLEVLAE